jgi:hypothetical protein
MLAFLISLIIQKKILKSRGWKLNYPDLFELIDKYPYIVKKEEK